jgi:hypothetical protein
MSRPAPATHDHACPAFVTSQGEEREMQVKVVKEPQDTIP